MKDLIKALFWAIWPQREAFETDQFYFWRAILGAASIFALGAVTMNYALAFGFVSVLGFSGFAEASEVASLVNLQEQRFATLDRKGNEIMATVIGGQISDLHFRQCSAIKSGSYDTVRALSEELQSRLDAYQGFKGQRYNLQNCP